MSDVFNDLPKCEIPAAGGYIPSGRCIVPRVPSKNPQSLAEQLGPGIRPPKSDFPASEGPAIPVSGSKEEPDMALTLVTQDTHRRVVAAQRAHMTVERLYQKAGNVFKGHNPFTPQGKAQAVRAVRLVQKAEELSALRQLALEGQHAPSI